MDPTKPQKEQDYISNPFKLAWGATERLFNTNKTWAIIILVLGIFSSLSSLGNNTGSNNTSDTTGSVASTANTNVTSIIAIVIVVSVIALIIIALVSVMAVYIQGILTYVALQSEKGKKATLSEATAAVSKRFGLLYWSQVLALVKILGWSLLLIVPGIIASLRYALLGYVIMDEPAENKSVKESHIRVKSLVQSRLWEVVGISSTGFVPIMGVLFDVTGKAAQYNQLKKYHDKKLEKPAIHWLNYLVFIAFAALIIISLVVAAIVIVAWNKN